MALAIIGARPSLAQTITATDSPVLLLADELSFDDQNQMAYAQGRIEVSQDGRLLLADTLVYDQQKDQVLAQGNIVLFEPTGEVAFADEAELSRSLRNGIVQQLAMRLPDESRLIAHEGERIDGRYVVLQQGLYSPCRPCAENPQNPPLWQLRADSIVHDNLRQDMYYRNAQLEFAGVPVAYSPYLSHPDPTVKRRSGFLAPVFGSTEELGLYTRTPYYFDSAPEQDFTLTPTFSSKDIVQIEGEWRRHFGDSTLEATGSLMYGESNSNKGDDWRGHTEGKFRQDMTDHWRSGLNWSLTSDDLYLRRYRISSEDILTNRVYGEYFSGRDYANIEAFYFQDLRPNINSDEPLVLPRARWSMVGAPAETLGGRWQFETSLLALHRQKSTDMWRQANSLGWQRELTHNSGIKTTLNASTRGDFYMVDNFISPSTPSLVYRREGTSRFFGLVSSESRWPFVKQSGRVQQLIEPIVSMQLSPDIKNNDKIPNEDSQDFAFDASNLLRPSRFTGIDKLEGGPRASYALNMGVFGAGGGSSSLIIGQSYRLNNVSAFPVGSGLEEQWSDFVGRVRLEPLRWLFADYSFRLSKDDFTPRQHDGTLSLFNESSRLDLNYLFVSDLAGTPDGLPREEISGAFTQNFAEFWTFGVYHKRNLQQSTPLQTGVTLNYLDECFNVGLVFNRDHTVRAGLQSGDSFELRLNFKNLGGISGPALRADQFRGTSRIE